MTVAVALGVELIRIRLHPELFRALTHPLLFMFGCATATTIVQLWTMSNKLIKVALTAFFTQASMPSVLLITAKFIEHVFQDFMALLSALTAVTPT